MPKLVNVVTISLKSSLILTGNSRKSIVLNEECSEATFTGSVSNVKMAVRSMKGTSTTKVEQYKLRPCNLKRYVFIIYNFNLLILNYNL